VSPLTALMMDQVEKIKKQGQLAAIIRLNVLKRTKRQGSKSKVILWKMCCADVLASCLPIRKYFISVVRNVEKCCYLMFIKKT